MQNYKYLIIGGGMTAASAVTGIREVDPSGSIGIFSMEQDKPYDRPPLTKALWKGKPIESVWRDTEEKNVQFHLGRTVKTLDPGQKTVLDDQQNAYVFEKLLLATGGRPRRLPFDADDIIYYRTLADYRWLRTLAEKNKRFAVIGGGFIGSEIAAALALNQKEVVMLFPGKGIGDRVFPHDLSQFLNEYYRLKGVEILTGESLEKIYRNRDAQFVLRTSTGRLVSVSAVVAGLGIEPNVELAQPAGLKVENGIVVNASLQTTDPHIYSAGDVASFWNPALARHLRVEHEDNANTMGRLAGRNMAGKSEPYHHLPFFYSDLFDLGYEAVGDLDARLQTVTDWKTPFREGVIYYLHDGRVRGVLLWNVWEQIDAARALIREPGPFRPNDLKGRLPQKN